MPFTEQELLAKIEGTFPMIGLWTKALATPFVPAPATDLIVDDEDWPWVPVSQIAVMGLSSAQDHLAALQQHVQARVQFLNSDMSLVRGALVGSSQAVWVLAPDDRDERLARARLIADHMYAQQDRYLTALQRIADEPHEGTNLVAAHVRMRHAQLREKRKAAGQRANLNNTEVVRSAAAAVFRDGDVVEEAVSIWRLTSGAAHGFVWPFLGHEGNVAGEPDELGIGVFEMAGDVSRIANGYLCAFHIARHGWSLRKLRGGR